MQKYFETLISHNGPLHVVSQLPLKFFGSEMKTLNGIVPKANHDKQMQLNNVERILNGSERHFL